MYQIEQISKVQNKVVFSHTSEREVAGWLFNAMQYHATHSPYIVRENGVILSQDSINKSIEVYFPEETADILKNISYEKTIIGKNLVKFNLIADWYFNYFIVTRKKIEQNKLKLN